MDFLHKFLGIALPPLMLIVFSITLAPFLFLKFLYFLKRSKYSENVAGKVILITGASSGIGEYVAYEYARRRACLALIARREDRLQEIANRARQLGSPEVIVVPADVSKVEDCKHFVDETVNHFGQLDHLVNNAGITRFELFEDSVQFSDFASIMVKIETNMVAFLSHFCNKDINFWGSIYSTHNAIPHLKKRKGKIVVLASTAAWLAMPRLGFYNASKAAIISFFETLKIELRSHIGITIVTPGLIKSEMSTKLSKAKAAWTLAKSTEGCAKAIVASACRGDLYLTEPSWMKVMFWMKIMCPEVLEWYFHSRFVKRRQTSKDS
ncbi:11-beta-hydroxysteroid dehydrogenase-like 4A isoform X1 [Quercus lobata]|uniref:11-beta-hydroxysteroid dehydrogenase-like 4A isoform X1 n=1 Tax=Quercus lobata TaxID=97700 RepID=UPI001244AC30|nr:11-beta-hydroxysteroid dehydrogenase-like 4A isoform X1 [Quercus lobata]